MEGVQFEYLDIVVFGGTGSIRFAKDRKKDWFSFECLRYFCSAHAKLKDTNCLLKKQITIIRS